ncbi:MAG: hypothetical protein ACYCXX_13970 [Acidiferrobacter thiooxydans]
MAQKYIYISDGDKGGVGKSFCSAAVAEALLERGKIALVEGDDSQPDLALRYQGDPDVLLGVLPLNESGAANRAVSKFAGWLETHQPDRVVINLPAGAAKTLAPHADLIRMSADEFGYKLVGLYALGKGDTPTAGLVKSLESGLLAQVDEPRRVVVYPAFQGDPHDFVWFDHPARKTFSGREIIMPFLDNRDVVRKMLTTPGRLTHLAKTPAEGWMVVDKFNLARWLKAAIAAVEPILNIED